MDVNAEGVYVPVFPNRIPRDRAAALGQETVGILDGGRYESPSGKDDQKKELSPVQGNGQGVFSLDVAFNG